MKLRTKLFATNVAIAVIPAALVSGLILWQTQKAFEETTTQAKKGLEKPVAMSKEELIKANSTDIGHITENVYAMCQAQQELLQRKVIYDLNVARDILGQEGKVSFANEPVTWKASNQYTKETHEVGLPKMLVGDTWLGQNDQIKVSSPVVDKVQHLVGGTCTLFQRMNDAGDMLRVCTNVQKPDETRAIGTFIPAVNPDGTPNEVVSTVMKGETYHGRAYVVNAWYITAYEPIKDASGKVAGVLYVGAKEESCDSLRKAIMAIKVGRAGYVYVLNAKGETRGHYVISKDGKRDGENIWESTDADGKFIIQDICKTALALKPGEIGEIRYPWKNDSNTAPRDKIVKLAYFAPWDWVIGSGCYEDELYEAVNKMEAEAQATLVTMQDLQSQAQQSVNKWLVGISAATLLVVISVSLIMARGIIKPFQDIFKGLKSFSPAELKQTGETFNKIIQGISESVAQVTDAAAQVSAASQQLAEGASEQASSLEETSSALEQMAAITHTNASNAAQADELAGQAHHAASAGDTTMTAINDSSKQISKIIKVIEEIAFQTNLLALNAAVEAARAGDHGKGFAVVADEVRNLAQRVSQAAKETTALIEDSVHRSREGAEAIQAIVDGVTKVSELIKGIAQASQEQAQGVEQLNTAVAQMDKVTQQNASGAEESASASEQLSAQAQSVKGIVNKLVILVEGDT